MQFNGEQKVIKLNAGTRSVEALDLYSAWKRWLAAGNAGFEPAFRVVGGEPLVAGSVSPTYFFLENGWQVEPANESHTLDVQFNLYRADGGDAFKTPSGDFTIRINNKVSDANTVTIASGSGLSAEQDQLLQSVYLALLGRRTQQPETGVIDIYNADASSVRHRLQAFKDGTESPLAMADEIRPKDNE